MARPRQDDPGVRRDILGHPRGLTVLVLTEAWAQFSYFGLQAMLVYFMTKELGYGAAKASLLFGAYTGAAYFTPFFGGLLADRLIGRTASVVLGGCAMAAGHFMLAFHGLFFPALALVALGNGAFVPPLAAQVGALYSDDDSRRDRAFSAYYMGINLGSFAAPIVCGALAETLGWAWGFSAAGAGMTLGLAVYLLNLRTLPEGGNRPARGAVARFSRTERRDLLALVVVALVVVVFRIAYEQSGNVIALWIDHDTDRTVALFGARLVIPATWFQSVDPLLILTVTPLIARRWLAQSRRGAEPAPLWKMTGGGLLLGAAYLVMVAAALVRQRAGAPVSAGWVLAFLVLMTIAEIYTIPVGLSIFSRLAPAHAASIVFGLWYLAKFAGGFVSGLFGATYGALGAAAFFAAGGGVALLSAAAFAGLAKLQVGSRASHVSAAQA